MNFECIVFEFCQSKTTNKWFLSFVMGKCEIWISSILPRGKKNNIKTQIWLVLYFADIFEYCIYKHQKHYHSFSIIYFYIINIREDHTVAKTSGNKNVVLWNLKSFNHKKQFMYCQVLVCTYIFKIFLWITELPTLSVYKSNHFE